MTNWVFWNGTKNGQIENYSGNLSFSAEQKKQYELIFNFYGEDFLRNEILAYHEYNQNRTVQDLLSYVSENLNKLQRDLERVFKADTSRLYYVNAIQRRGLFIEKNLSKTEIAICDIASYEILKFELFPEFDSMNIHPASKRKFDSAFSTFQTVIQKLDSIDPYGNLYFTKSLDDEMTKILLTKFPNYKKYFDERSNLKSIMLDLTNDATNLKFMVFTLIQLEAEKSAMRSINFSETKDLSRQLKILTSSRSESIYKRLIERTMKLNFIFLTFNISFVLENPKKDKIVKLRELTDNFFYSDYLLTRDSVEAQLKQQLFDIIETLK